MGYKSTSTRRTSAASAVSSQSVVVNTPTGFSAVGATIKSNTSISLGVTTAGQTSAATTTTVSAGPSITTVQYLDASNQVLDDDIAISTAGGNVLINGTGFVTGSNVYVNNSLVSNTFVSSTQIIATLPSASAGNVSLMIFSPTNTGTLKENAIRYSGAPTWTTAAAALQNGIAANVSLVASSDGTLTYTLQDGSTLPTGISLNSAGYLTGTPTGYSSSTSVSVVIIATDTEGQATQQTINISISTGDDQFKYTTLLLNGETSVTPFIKDSSSNNFALILGGDVKANRFSPYYGDGYYSNSFSATPDYYLLPVSANLAFAGDYTIECWVYLNSVSGTQGVYSSIDNSADAWQGPYIGFSGTSFLATSYISSPDTITHQTAVAVGQWYHLAMVRSGSTTKSYLNGVQSTGTTTSSYSLTQSGSSIGTAYPGSGPLNGYISNLRIVKGTALYTTNFTPPTAPLTAISGTQLLTCQSNRAIDVSSNAFTLTATGTPRVSPAIPFATNSSYATYGSAYFDGTGDYITTPGNTAFDMGTGDFTVECFVTTNGYAGSQYGRGIFALYPSGNYNNRIILRHTTADNRLNIYGAASGSAYLGTSGTDGTTALKVGTWNHIALVRQSGVFRVYINGVQDIIISNQTAISLASSNCFDIGRCQDGSTPDWNGYIADFRVVKGTAVYTSSFTPPAEPLSAISGTSLLTLQYNGSVNNSTIVDSGLFNLAVTKTGTTTQGTFSPYSQTGWSNYFSGSDYLTVPNINFSTNAFTIEGWFYPLNVANTLNFWGTDNGSGSSPKMLMYIDSSSRLTVDFGSAGTTQFPIAASISTYGLAANQWNHIALVRSDLTSTGLKLYINGTLAGTGQCGTNLNTITATFNIGYIGEAYGNKFNGYISNFRIVNGTAVYTEAFTPPASPLSAVANTSILTCQSNQFKDNSSNNSTVTLSGTPSVQAFSSFSPSAVYTPSLHGSSTYMSNATANYLTVTDSNIWNTGPTTPAFTVEAWIYPIGITGGCVISGMYANSKVPFVIGIGNAVGVLATSNQIWFGHYSGSWAGVISTAALTMNQWTHVAGVYTGTDKYLYVNGVKVATSTATWPAFDATTTAGYIGKRWDGTGSGANGFNGYISDVRITKGSALYTAATVTPPSAPLTASSSTSLLLNMAGNGIVDAHSSNNIDTVGNAQVSTAVKKYGNASMFFDGTGDYLSIPTGPTLTFGTGSFTIECWWKSNGAQSNYAPILSNYFTGSPTTGTWAFKAAGASSVVEFTYWNGSSLVNIDGTSSVNDGNWHHIAVVRNGTTVTIYVDGTSQASSTVTYAIGTTSAPTYVGYQSRDGAYINGWVDDLRITNGFARYTANFTAPATGHLGQ